MTDQGKTLQLFYAGLMVDTAANYEHFGITAKVTAKKEMEQRHAAPGQLKQLGIETPEALFQTLSSLFGCASWTLERAPDGELAGRTTTCLACAIAKKRGAGRPCDLFCINPFRAFVAALPPGHRLQVTETLWEGERCTFLVSAM